MKILIIGGGVAGLTLAARLNAAGTAVTLVERADTLATGGYVVGLYKNGIDVLQQLGAYEQVMRVGWLPAYQLLTDAHGRRLRYTDLSVLNEKHGAALRFYTRADLCAELAALLSDDNDVRLGTTVSALSENAEGVEVELTGDCGGKKEVFDAVVGADGIASATRRQLFGDAGEVRHDGVFFYTLVQTAALDVRQREMLSAGDIEMLGARGFFGIYPVSKSYCGVYAALYQNSHSGGGEVDGKVDGTAARQALQQHFADYTPYASALLAQVGDDVFSDALREVDLPRWGTRRCFLIGDAAHALLPTSGQGVSLALEDGAQLAEVLLQPQSVWAAAFARFEAARRARLKPIRRLARLRNSVITATPAVLCPLRDWLIRIVLGRGKARQLDAFFQSSTETQTDAR